MRETLPLGGHHFFDLLVARRLQRFYDRIAARNPQARAILDVGCGPGHLAAAIAKQRPHADVLGVDLDPVQIRLARRHQAPNLDFAVAGAHELGLPAASRDWVVATETFHHWSKPEASLAEIHRVLKPGGSFWIIEGAGDMTRDELAAWTGRRPFPGLTTWVRLIFRTHGYTPKNLYGRLLPLLEGSSFEKAVVTREDGWWIIELPKAPARRGLGGGAVANALAGVGLLGRDARAPPA